MSHGRTLESMDWETFENPTSHLIAQVDNSDKHLMATTSSCSTKPLGKYDVFLNHRGPDAKKTFVAHLDDALCTAGFNPFLDAKSLVKGERASISIDEALNGVGVHVAIFSKRYAESKYCLNELCAMLKSKKPIIPVYYDIEPENLRRPYDGPFAEGFMKHKERGRHNDVKRWEMALLEAADIVGFRLAGVKGDEAELKRSIVNAVVSALPIHQLLQVPRHRVGLEEATKNVVEKLNGMGEGVGVLGIVGMGGIGKTTLAKEVYNHFAKKHDHFKSLSFLKDVRGSAFPDLQKKLVHDLLHEDVSNRGDIRHVYNRLRGQKVLIVIDDVDNQNVFDELVGPCIKDLAQGSRVLITSRDRNILNNIMREGKQSALYEVDKLGLSDSLQLFTQHAFDSEEASGCFRDLAREVADACGGLPLALEVIGRFLYDKRNPGDENCWRQSTQTLRENEDILNRLKISYDGLCSDADKLMFLDIACFLNGVHKDKAMQMWETCDYLQKGPLVSLCRLMDKSLVKLDMNGLMTMHDLLRDMGRDVVTKQSRIEGKRSHLWDPSMAKRVLQKNQGTDRVRALFLDGSHDGATWVAEKFGNLSELRILILYNCHVEGEFSNWSTELRWLEWTSSPLLELPSKLNIGKLAVLDLSHSISLTNVWPKDIEFKEVPCKDLRVLVLRKCVALEEVPQHIGKLSRLRMLSVEGCLMLKALPNSIGQLKELEHLYVCGCVNLESLPETIVNLSKLHTIHLANCTHLKELPVLFGALRSLVNFSANGSSLSKLPNSFSQLSNLEWLDLNKCKYFTDLPPSIGGLGKLEVLKMAFTRVERLPKDFGQLRSLSKLKLKGCKHLQSLPDNFGGLSNLQKLYMTGCRNLTMLPERFGRLKALVELNLQTCSFQGNFLSDFGALTALTMLDLSYNPMTILPDSLGDLLSLNQLILYHCQNLIVVEALPCRLERLNIHDCPKLREAPSLEKLSLLRFLKICRCTKLTKLQGLDSLTSLEEVNLSGCTMLQKTLTGLKYNKALKECYLSGSNISVPYDNNWFEPIPECQVVSYYDNTLGFINNGMVRKAEKESWAFEICMEVGITSPKACIVVLFCFVAHDQGWSNHPEDHGLYNSQCFMEACIVRDTEEIHTCKLFNLREADNRDQVYICTLRRLHPFVCALQHGDMVRVYARSKLGRWAITVKQGAICVVHASLGDVRTLEVVVNGGSDVGSYNMSQEEMKAKFSAWVLVDNPHLRNLACMVDATTGDVEEIGGLVNLDSMAGIMCDEFANEIGITSEKIANKSGSMFEANKGIHFVNRRFTCDSCNDWIEGQRWRCDFCPDFDLCSTCHEEADFDQMPTCHKIHHPMTLRYL